MSQVLLTPLRLRGALRLVFRQHQAPNFLMATEGQEQHYANVAKVYESTWCYQEDGECQKYLCREVVGFLPKACKSIVDLGCGTGSFSIMLQRASGVTVQGVEPSAAMAAKAEERGLPVVVDGALEWAASETGVAAADLLLLKEVRHHFEDPAKVYKALAERRMAPGGRILMITRPDTSQSYPFPAAAHTAWEAGITVKMDRHLEALEAAGLSNIQVVDRPFPVSMQREEWERLLRMRFWSNLSAVSDEDMESGIADLKLPDTVEFDDQFKFIVADKPL
mmetsp:Transcript_25997/g.60768  ORF Transcript_25997/g.60768 Transcript_25997/m.60768 type:complete len:279 (+) Transcript_25997:36-872(+)